MTRPPPISPLFPYPPLSRSGRVGPPAARVDELAGARRVVDDDAILRVHRVAEERRSEEHTSELQSRQYLVCRLLLEKKKINNTSVSHIIQKKNETSTKQHIH